MKAFRPERFASGFLFPESPRWWNGSLWLSDMFGKTVYRVDAACSPVAVAHLEGMPSGLGTLPDGSRVVAEMATRRLRRLTADGLDPEPLADLAGFTDHWLNDLVTAEDGHTYTGCFGHDIFAGETPAPGAIVVTQPDGTSRLAAEELLMPNGIVISEDGSTLLVAQSYGAQITAFDRHLDGSLTNRRTWAEIPGSYPDGLCLDAEGAVWFGDCRQNEFARVVEGGRITHRISSGERLALAPALGGPERRTLYLLSCDTDDHRSRTGDMAGYVDAVDVDVPAAGRP